MEAFLEYIMMNYTWFLGGAIIILLAIIGYYADETNFGQGKENDQKNNNQIQNENEMEKGISEVIESNQQQLAQQPIQETILNQPNDITENNTLVDSNNENISEVIEPNQNQIEQQPIEDVTLNQSVNTIETNVQNDLNNQNVTQTDFETQFEEFDKEFEEILPQKETIDDELLDEIDNLSFDKTQKIDISDISNFDDVELPKIKTMKTEEQDIWKF